MKTRRKKTGIATRRTAKKIPMRMRRSGR